MALIIFSLSFLFIIYLFAGYPVLLLFLGLLSRRTIEKAEIFPSVTVIIPVHNEEKSIGTKIRNCLEAVYPQEKLRVIVASDNSTDRTEEIVRQFPADQVNFVAVPFRGGKVVAQNFALSFCNSEIIIFTDVAISVDPGAIKTIVENFHDPSVGTVSCRDAVLGDKTKGKGEGLYIKYDMLVRKLTTQVGSLVGVTGGFYATRLEIAKGGWNPAFPPDFYVALRTIKRRARVVEDPRVKAYYKTARQEWDELPRKVRTITRGMTALFSRANLCLLNPIHYGIVTVELLSHKLFRWALPLFLAMLFVSNIFLAFHSAFFSLLLCLQITFCLLNAICFYGPDSLKKWSLCKILFYFTLANVALIHSWFGLLTGKRYTKWQPTKR